MHKRRPGLRFGQKLNSGAPRALDRSKLVGTRERGGRADPSRHAFMEACAWSGILFSASPTRQDCLPTPLYLIRIAYLLGRIPARFASALGMAVGEEPGADAVDRRMTVGAGGVELLTANPRGCRVTRPHVHDQIARRLVQMWGEYVGFSCSRDERAAASWFDICIPIALRAEYRQQQR